MSNKRRRNRSQIESLLAILHFGTGLASLTFSILVTIVWRYWKDVLNTCMDAHCNCILYATALSHTVIGSDTAICKYVAFLPVPITIWATIMGSYHGYRACIRRTNYSANRRRSAMFVNEAARLHSKKNYSLGYSCLFIISSIIVIIGIGISITVTYGYYSTCASYRTAVLKQLSATGNLAAMVQERMSCSTVYDFLDYIQPEPDYMENKFRRNTYIINTGLLLQIAIISTWLSVLAWLAIVLLNLFLIFKS
ncbi:uncharacterized protein LOC111056109 [Nilaparvata lugens]|uniref:uncharacterized protein LOC111056109 n=1 Tax=Nilaparvata lugens TaxID=108931 RepID=UPI00193E0663|nr:uncharacterized protein LOC111056109 [Nilaparvata lugens]XP_039276967.1 uncharacterized protein LOC111056109 [Nilaparvata lugens]